MNISIFNLRLSNYLNDYRSLGSIDNSVEVESTKTFNNVDCTSSSSIFDNYPGETL